MPKAFITFNADDFGMTHGVTAGICHALAHGVVTSTSVMVCVPGSEEHVRAGQAHAAGVLGLHLQLTDGVPVLPAPQIPSLVDANGAFPRKAPGMQAALNPDEVLAEWSAQLQRLQSWGIEPAYFDTHHHVHIRRADALPALVQLARRHQKPVRSKGWQFTRSLRQQGVICPDVTITDFYGAQANWDALELMLLYAARRFGRGAVIEVCCHPGYSDAALAELSYYTTQREEEMRILTQEATRERLRELQFKLIGMDEIARYRGR